MPDNTTAPTEEAQEKSALTLILENAKKCRAAFPASISYARNNVTVLFKPTKYTKGDKKEAGIEYIGPDPTWLVVDNFENLVNFVGIEKAFAAVKNMFVSTCQAATEDACSTGIFDPEVVRKGIEEFSARGESSTALKQELEEINEELDQFAGDPLKMAEFLSKDTPQRREYLDMLSRAAQIRRTLDSRKRGPRT